MGSSQITHRLRRPLQLWRHLPGLRDEYTVALGWEVCWMSFFFPGVLLGDMVLLIRRALDSLLALE